MCGLVYCRFNHTHNIKFQVSIMRKVQKLFVTKILTQVKLTKLGGQKLVDRELRDLRPVDIYDNIIHKA